MQHAALNERILACIRHDCMHAIIQEIEYVIPSLDSVYFFTSIKKILSVNHRGITFQRVTLTKQMFSQ